MAPRETPPRLLTIAGSDSGGGAGIQADLKTFAAHGTYGMSVVTAVTAQNTVGVFGVEMISAELVTRQLDAVFDDIGVDAVKIGMLGSPEIVEAVAQALDRRPPRPVVLDPVMIAKSGDALISDEAIETLKEKLLPLATLVTPNLPEAARLTGLEVEGEVGRREAARRLTEIAGAALVKGGHGQEDPLLDLLWDGQRLHRFEWPRQDTSATHGTGCTLSSAIAANLGLGHPLEEAVERAGRYLQAAMSASAAMGSGAGPLNHFPGFHGIRF